ncbi:MAG: hypothetical protein IPO77_10810 [Acidobacteria bacterium]|nr:hypothetical protein [Acidobacteriota bacterium]
MKIDRSRKSTLILPALMLLTGCFFSVHALAQTIPTPESVLGFKPGQERRLASWDQFLGYFRKLDEASDRVKLDLLGQTTLKRPFVALTISSADNLARLEEYKDIQRKLADPRLLEKSDDAAISKLIAAGKTIVVITCSIHSTEVGGTFAAVELAHRLASSESPEVKLILDNVIVLLVRRSILTEPILLLNGMQKRWEPRPKAHRRRSFIIITPVMTTTVTGMLSRRSKRS